MLNTLRRLVQEVNRIPSLEQALTYLSEQLCLEMQVDSCSIYLADYQQLHFLLIATRGLEPSAVGQVKIGFSEGLIGLIGQREEPLNIANAPSHSRFKHYPEVKEEKYHAFLGAPIIHQRKVLGVITLQQQQQRRFSEDEEAFLVTLAAQLALEIVNAEARGALVPGHTPSRRQHNLQGLPGSAGLACGEGYVPGAQARLRDQRLQQASDAQAEMDAYLKAIKQTRAQVEQFSQSIADTVPEDVRAIFQIYHHLLDANSLGNEVEEKIKRGWNAISALKMVTEDYVTRFRAMQDPYMQERAIDLEDLGNRVFNNLLGNQPDHRPLPDAPCILVAEEITASMLADFAEDKLAGLISIRGSHNSHAAILARALGLPAVMGLANVPLSLLDGKDLLLDGYSGEVVISPHASAKNEFLALIEEEQQLWSRIAQQQGAESSTQDGEPIQLLINTGLAADLGGSHRSNSQGVGLYRTEVPFMQGERFPSEQEQFQWYRDLLSAYPEHSVTMRTLDVGGDKPLPYFPIKEENPFLGWRGIRLTLDHPEIFLVQVRAMLRASLGLNNLQIMLPMISSIEEVRECKRLLRQAYHEVREEPGGNTLSMPTLGVMLEVPSTLYLLPQLASLVDFFSVGSNDLTQYLLAVDRNNARVAELYDSYHPAVLHALQQIVQQANTLNTPVTLCGELAGEPGGLLLLIGMGYRRLSMNSHNLLKAKWVIRSVSLTQSQQLLRQVLTLDSPQQVREAINIFLESRGLGGLVRAGI